METCRSSHSSLLPVVGQPAVSISYKIVDLEYRKELSTPEGYGVYKAVFSTNASADVVENPPMEILKDLTSTISVAGGS